MNDLTTPARTTTLNSTWLRRRLQQQTGDNAGFTMHLDPDRRHAPFPLTDMQQAYWLGRDGDLAGGGAMQMYQEFDGALLDITRLEKAWNRLIARHDMLRACVDAGGQQRVLQDVPFQHIETTDLSASADKQADFLAIRSRILAETPPLDMWPQSRLACVIMEHGSPGYGHLLMRLDMWCFDGRSFQIIIEDLAALYSSPDCDLPELGVTFRDYVLARQRYEQTGAFETSLAWWQARLPTLAPSPPLPFEKPTITSKPRFERVGFKLDAAMTASLKQHARENDIGLPSLFATAYAQVLSRWSGQTHFTLNVPRFNRPDWHDGLNNVVGEFASFTLLEISLNPGASFAENARLVQKQLWTDLSHADVSGVRLLRELGRSRGAMDITAMPVVFTTMPERRAAETASFEEAIRVFGTIGYSLTGTPQVWLDSQYFELDGALHCNWDAVEGLFADGVLSEMFDSYRSILTGLATGQTAWDRPANNALPAAQAAVRQRVNNQPCEAAHHGLFALIADHARSDPDAFAVLDSSLTISRATLSRAAGSVARHLRQRGIGRGQAVAVHVRRGWQGIAAALGIINAGAIYMPLDRDSPAARLNAIIANVKPALVLTDATEPVTDQPDEQCADIIAMIAAATKEDALSAAEPVATDCAVIIHTSGSTGTPKGVMIPWASLAHAVAYSNNYFALSSRDRAVMITANHHDLSLYDLFGPLAAGAGLITLDSERALDPEHWLDRVRAGQATFWNSVPRLAEAFVSHVETTSDTVSALRRFVLGGDFVPQNLPARMFSLWPQTGVTTVGGPTETTLWNIMNEVSAGEPAGQPLAYGKPIPLCSYRIIDKAGRDCPDYVAGEMVCSGISITLGYINMPGETAQRYTTDPDTCERRYHTGDRGRYRPDGTIEILGRIDSQLNAGGYRADPAEIEAVITRFTGIQHAVVVARNHHGAERICAFYTTDSGQPVSESALQTHCASFLPPALVPRLWQPIPAMPLTANGKVDRNILQHRPFVTQDTATGRPLKNPIAQNLAAIWSEILSLQPSGGDANFFADGGDSIKAMRVINRIDQTLGVRLPLGAFFNDPTLSALAALTTAGLAARTGLPETEITALDGTRLTTLTGNAQHRDTLPAADPENLQLSWSQERLWFLDRLAGHNALYIMPFSTEIKGNLSIAALREAVSDVMLRHQPLRTVFPAADAKHGERLQILEAPQPSIRVADLTGHPGHERNSAWTALVSAATQTPFQLDRECPIRVIIATLGPDEYRLCCILHHIAFDGWSIGLFNRDLFEAYAARCAGKTPDWSAVAPYVDFAAWQKASVSEAQMQVQEEWWSTRLSDFAPLTLSGDHIAPRNRSYAASSVTADISSSLLERVDAFARATDTTVNVVLLTAFALALGRREQQSRFIIGSSAAGRDHAATENMVGFFVKNVPVCADLEKELSFRALVRQMRGEFLDSLDHLDLPFQRLVASLAPDRDPSRNPLYGISFTYENAPRDGFTPEGLSLASREARPATSHLDLEMLVWPTPDGASCNAIFSSEIFHPQSVEDICNSFLELLEKTLANPDSVVSSLPLSHAGRAVHSQTAAAPFQAPLWDQIVAGIACASLVDADGGLIASGHDLLSAAGQLDAALAAAATAPAAPVAILAHPGHDYVVAILACLRRGSPYALIDPMLPPEAVLERLSAAGIHTLLCAAALKTTLSAQDGLVTIVPSQLPAYRTIPDPAPAQDPDAAMLMVWTSGSTGTPKAPVLTQKALLNRLHWDRTTFTREDNPAILLKTSPSFVDSVAEILQPLIDGFIAIVPDPEAVRAPSGLLQTIHTARPTRLVLTPSMLRAMLDAEDSEVSPHPQTWPLRRLHLSGEPLSADLVIRLAQRLEPDTRVLNIYGSAEVTADVTCHSIDISAADTTARIPIGLPLPGCTIWLLDASRRPVAEGAVGEMHVAGLCLARAYHRQEALSQRSFFDWTAPDGSRQRLYATGDLARYVRPQGATPATLIPLGRRDAQIKIRGVRIEPGEVEARLMDLPAIRAALVMAHQPEPVAGKPAAPELVAYIQPHSSATTSADTQARENHWRLVYDQSYEAMAAAGNLLDDYTIWQSVIDGTPLQHDHMQAWVEANLAIVRERSQQSVVEIGCGQGLLLGRLAPDCSAYLGTDISAQALACIDRLRQTAPHTLSHVQTAQCSADQPLPENCVPRGGFDTALLSSVVQYFPDAAYLLSTLEALMPDIAENGRIILSDLRSFSLNPLLATEILLARSEDHLDRAALIRRLHQLQAHEAELLVDPGYFLTLSARLPRIAAVEARPKPGPHDNELNAYRYDVILYLDQPPEGAVVAGQLPEIAAQAVSDQTALARLINQHAQASDSPVILRNIPHRRLHHARQAQNLLDTADLADARAWRQMLARTPHNAQPSGLDPATIRATASAHGWQAAIVQARSGAAGTFDVLITKTTKADTPQPRLLAIPFSKANPAATAISTPHDATTKGSIVAAARQHLTKTLPQSFLPNHFVIISNWPKTPSNKINRNKLPKPQRQAMTLPSAPLSDMETCIADIWAQTLGSAADPDTSFFEAGGNSLLLAEVHQHLVRKLDRRFPLIELFRHTSIRAQAKYLSDEHTVLSGAAGAGRSRALLRRGGGKKNR